MSFVRYVFYGSLIGGYVHIEEYITTAAENTSRIQINSLLKRH